MFKGGNITPTSSVKGDLYQINKECDEKSTETTFTYGSPCPVLLTAWEFHDGSLPDWQPGRRTLAFCSLRRVLVSLLVPVQPLSCRPVPKRCFSHKDPFRSLKGERATPTRSAPNPFGAERSQVGMVFICLKALKCLVLLRLGALPPYFWLVKQKSLLKITQLDIQNVI